MRNSLTESRSSPVQKPRLEYNDGVRGTAHCSFAYSVSAIRTCLAKDDELSTGGVKGLPFDVLSYIFRYVCAGDAEGSRAILISHVCRCFREVALNIAGLWTCLFSQDPIAKTATFLSRTKEADLIVLVEEDPRSLDISHLETFMALVIPCCYRWSEFRYVPKRYFEDISCESICRELEKLTVGLNLPRLRRLEIYAGPNEGRGFEITQEPGICSDWWTPALTRLVCWNGQPDIRLFKNITSLSVRCENWSSVRDDTRLLPLLEALATLRHVETLELSLMTVDCKEDVFPVTELPSLKFLHLHVKDLEDNTALHGFRSALRLPSLQNLSLIIELLDGTSTFQETFVCVLFEPNQCPSVREIHIERQGAMYRSGPRPFLSLDTVFGAFPNVHHLFINLIDLDASYSMAPTPVHLQTISIICNEIEVSDLERLVRRLESAPGHSNFAKFAIFSEARSSHSSSLGGLAGGKLVFERQEMKRPVWTEEFMKSILELDDDE